MYQELWNDTNHKVFWIFIKINRIPLMSTVIIVLFYNIIFIFINKPGTCWKDISLHTIIIIISNQKWSIYNFIKERISYLQYNPAFLEIKMAKMNTQRPTHNNCSFESHCKIFLGYHEQRYILMINMAHLWIHIVANFRINDNKHTTYNQKRKNVLSKTMNSNYTKYWLNERLFHKSKFFSKILIQLIRTMLVMLMLSSSYYSD